MSTIAGLDDVYNAVLVVGGNQLVNFNNAIYSPAIAFSFHVTQIHLPNIKGCVGKPLSFAFDSQTTPVSLVKTRWDKNQ